MIRIQQRDGTFAEELVGVVLADREKNYHDDSDFYVLYWDEEDQCVLSRQYATTRFGGTDHNTARVDATPEVRAKADAWWKREVLRPALIDERDRLARTVEVGDVVVVRRGRKVPHGTEGRVVAIEPEHKAGAQFGYKWMPARLTLATVEGRAWTNAPNVEILSKARAPETDEAIDARVAGYGSPAVHAADVMLAVRGVGAIV